MLRSYSHRFGIVIGIVTSLGTALALATCTLATAAETTQPPTGQAVAQSSSLRVTGTAQQFTVEADHADVQKALKSLFDQANKQFDIDSTVAGQVTLRLTDQAFETTLKSVCKQTFLRYHQDPTTGIYHFERDTDAIKQSFTHLDSLNADLRQQLRALGLDLPGDAQLDRQKFQQNRAQAKGMISAPAGAGGGRTEPPTASQNGIAAVPQSLGGLNGPSGPGGPAPDAKPRYKEGTITLPPGVPLSALELLMIPPGIGRNTSLNVQEGYLQFLRQNNLVAIYTNGAQYPMTDVLNELGRQANVEVLIDPSVPRGKQFRINLNMPPQTLEEALNIILPGARLRWRMIGSSLYITPTANFQIFYGSAPQPYVIYGNTSNGQSQLQRGLNNSQQPPTENGGQGVDPK